MTYLVRGLDSLLVHQLRNGGADAHGQPALRTRARGLANPCRHCLGLIAEGEGMLVLSHRPFTRLQPYAEAGPIFLHERACERYAGPLLPPWFTHLQPALVRGYDSNDWIVYETGAVVPGAELGAACAAILARPDVAYVHVRSKFNCFQCRVDRA